jgi:hypothetical protein
MNKYLIEMVFAMQKKKEYRSTRGAGGAGGQEEADSDGEEDEVRVLYNHSLAISSNFL